MNITIFHTVPLIPNIIPNHKEELGDSMNGRLTALENIWEDMLFVTPETILPFYNPTPAQKVVLPSLSLSLKRRTLPRQFSTVGFIKCIWTIFLFGEW